MVVMGELGSELAKRPVCGSQRCGAPITDQRVHIRIGFFRLGNLGCDLFPEIVGVGLMSVGAFVFS